MINYKGYIAKIEYDDTARIFAGEVLNTRTVITFQGSTVDEIEQEFHNSVDDYLEWCKEDGVAPEKPFSGHFNVRFEPVLHQEAALAAKSLGISLNKFIEKAVKDELATITV